MSYPEMLNRQPLGDETRIPVGCDAPHHLPSVALSVSLTSLDRAMELKEAVARQRQGALPTFTILPDELRRGALSPTTESNRLTIISLCDCLVVCNTTRVSPYRTRNVPAALLSEQQCEDIRLARQRAGPLLPIVLTGGLPKTVDPGASPARADLEAMDLISLPDVRSRLTGTQMQARYIVDLCRPGAST